MREVAIHGRLLQNMRATCGLTLEGRKMRTLLATSVALLLAASSAWAASITGSWQGSGRVTLNGGQIETVRCRVSYEAGSGRTFVISATCAHSNGIFKQTGRVVQINDSTYTGRLYSDDYGVAGDLKIRVSGSRQTVTATSDNGSASLTLSRQ